VGEQYGLGFYGTSTAASGDDFAAAGSNVYTFPDKMAKVWVQNTSKSTATLKVYWNADAATDTASGWDFELPPDRCAWSPLGIMVGKVAIYADGAAIYGQHFVVKGYK
jgi:hypothetical protein